MCEEAEYSVLGEIAAEHRAFCHVPEHGFSLFLAERTKTVHFVRHAEGFHNAAIREHESDEPTIHSTAGSEAFLDARLTPRGEEQCKEVRAKRLGGINPQLVVVSPLTRTLQTASLIFGGREVNASCAGEQRPPFLAHDLCRERWGKYTNDARRPASQIKEEFAKVYEASGDTIDFDSFGFATEEDTDWTPEREPSESVTARGIELLKWLKHRPETEIAVVTHSSFLRHLFAAFGDDLSNADRNTLQRSTGNAEVRSVVLASHHGC